ncbi:hypothetical protein BVC80_8227g10 [Macleaya cordata]|uniref:Uncharacterized protein n=1 Tax=Macleaya cordata TaxID=56857 RepID=A0A200QFG8_MACCD|nr:hypothetical protein BVC80_7591g2 [Macleaya cordata]OVA09155.1 hypothetical protein BVC80_8227g10 [Macleaya cordata]
MSESTGEMKAWNFGFCRTPNRDELPELYDFLQVIGEPNGGDEEDERSWIPNKGIFSTNSSDVVLLEEKK